MGNTQKLKLLLGLSPAILLIILVLIIFFCRRRSCRKSHYDIENTEYSHEVEEEEEEGFGDVHREVLVTFNGGDDLIISDVLDAPGEVIGKSSYGTLYRALLQRKNCVRLLRFLRPACSVKVEEFGEVIELLGEIRHPNLVPLLGCYGGCKGEKLLIYPFYGCGNLAQFIRDGNDVAQKWTVVCRITVGIAKGLAHLHTGLKKPVIHGNLKSKNIFLDRNYQPFVSDFGLNIILNPTAGQELLEASAIDGYKAPELIKMKDANEETDIYSFGVVLLELLSGKESVNENRVSEDDFSLPSFMRNAVLDNRISDLYRPGLLISSHENEPNYAVNEEKVLKLFQLAMACCSPSPSIRPSIKRVLTTLSEIIVS